ncbi:hypothetical protein WR25_14030 [Diploscapter pachys]|uniref:Uncharacterized protein n=1 Tax=Diploscapter pachys TaxID=2018661 RepID=A0A2A2KVH3_9BILA|nr:hypothetical protein WR25_14030 [Diploscapter pachys]
MMMRSLRRSNNYRPLHSQSNKQQLPEAAVSGSGNAGRSRGKVRWKEVTGSLENNSQSEREKELVGGEKYSFLDWNGI